MSPTTSDRNGTLWGLAAADWAEIQEPTCRSVYVATFDRLITRPGMRYLDVGCGAGLALTLAAGRGAVVSGLDASENLLGFARERLPEGDLHKGELEQLPFADASFDLVTGFNAFQYAANPTSALAEAKRVTRPGGTVLIMTWGRPEGMQAASLVGALRPLLPAPPTGAPGPFALSDETALRELAGAAGLTPGEIYDVDSPWVYADLGTALRGLRSSGVAARAIEHTCVDAVDRAHAEALAPFRQGDGSYRIEARFRCLITRV